MLQLKENITASQSNIYQVFNSQNIENKQEGWEVHFAIDMHALSFEKKQDLDNRMKRVLSAVQGLDFVIAEYFSSNVNPSSYFGKGLRLFFQDTDEIKLSVVQIKLLLLTIWKNFQKENIPLVTVVAPGDKSLPGPSGFPTPLSITCKEKNSRGPLYKDFQPINQNHPLSKLQLTAIDLEQAGISYDIKTIQEKTSQSIQLHTVSIQKKCQSTAAVVNQQPSYAETLKSYPKLITALEKFKTDVDSLENKITEIEILLAGRLSDKQRTKIQEQLMDLLGGTADDFYFQVQQVSADDFSTIRESLLKMSAPDYLRIINAVLKNIKEQFTNKIYNPENSTSLQDTLTSIKAIVTLCPYANDSLTAMLTRFINHLETKNIEKILENQAYIWQLLEASQKSIPQIQQDFSRHFVSTNTKVRPISIYNFGSAPSSQPLQIDASQYLGEHHEDYDKLIANNPKEMQGVFQDAFSCARAEQENLQLIKEMEQTSKETKTATTTLIDQGLTGIKLYQERGKKGFLESHLSFWSYFFDSESGQNRATFYFNHINSNPDITDQLIGFYALLDSKIKGDTLKYDVASKILENTAVLKNIIEKNNALNFNEVKPKIIDAAKETIKEFLLFHIHETNKNTWQNYVSSLQKQSNQPPCLPPLPETEELIPSGFWR